MKIITKLNTFLKKSNEVMKALNGSIDLFQIIYKNTLSIIGIFTLYNVSPTLWFIAMFFAVVHFIFELVRKFK